MCIETRDKQGSVAYRFSEVMKVAEESYSRLNNSSSDNSNFWLIQTNLQFLVCLLYVQVYLQAILFRLNNSVVRVNAYFLLILASNISCFGSL